MCQSNLFVALHVANLWFLISLQRHKCICPSYVHNLRHVYVFCNVRLSHDYLHAYTVAVTWILVEHTILIVDCDVLHGYNRYELSGHNLIVHPVPVEGEGAKTDVEGDYTCKADNGYSSSEHTATLYVPTVPPPPREYRPQWYSIWLLTCTVEGEGAKGQRLTSRVITLVQTSVLAGLVHIHIRCILTI